jgi:zinc/manganese transport system permease protein
LKVSSSPLVVPLLSVGFGIVSMVGGIMLALGGSVPISPYVTTISFLIYVVCRIVAWSRKRRGVSGRRMPVGAVAGHPTRRSPASAGAAVVDLAGATPKTAQSALSDEAGAS